ncbi:hypothetical protein GCM10010273_28360 [Streptomyces lavendulocolor]
MADWEASQCVEDTMPKVPRSVGRVVNIRSVTSLRGPGGGPGSEQATGSPSGPVRPRHDGIPPRHDGVRPRHHGVRPRPGRVRGGMARVPTGPRYGHRVT